MTNINDPGRPGEPGYEAAAGDEAIFRDVAAERGLVPEQPEGAFEPPERGGVAGSDSTAEAAKEQAQELAGHAKEQAEDVASSVKDKAAEVAGTAKSEARQLFSQVQEELQAQASQQQQRAASGLSATAEDLRDMAQSSQSDGAAARLVRQAGERAERAGRWLAEREPGDLLDEVRSFARRRPGVFIAAAVVAGLAAGRVTRSLKDGEA